MTTHGGAWGIAAMHALLADPTAASLLARCSTPAERLRIVEAMCAVAVHRLADAVARVPKAEPRIVEHYRAKGLPAPAWNLADDDDAVTFTLALARHDPTPAECDAAALLRACVLARELGDVAPFAEVASAGRSARQRSGAAAQPRPKKRDPVRAALVESLRRHRGAGRTLAEALAAMADVTHGLRVRKAGVSYRIADESTRGARPRVLSQRTLETLWTEAGKPRSRRT